MVADVISDGGGGGDVREDEEEDSDDCFDAGEGAVIPDCLSDAQPPRAAKAEATVAPKTTR
jgi:hypothetical protein